VALSCRIDNYRTIAHIDTGRGLAIYRVPLVTLFKNYGHTHVYPIFYIIAASIAYKSLSGDLGGGTLPLIMIYFLCGSVFLSPAIFNPALTNGSLQEINLDMFNFMIWIGKTESRLFLSETAVIEQQKFHNSLLSHFILIDYENMAPSRVTAIRGAFYHFTLFVFWVGVCTFLLYPNMQFWGLFYLSFWCINTALYAIIFYFLQEYEQPLRIIVIYLGMFAGMLYFLISFGTYGILDFAEMYIPFLIFVKVLEAFRGLICDCAVISAYVRYPDTESQPPVNSAEDKSIEKPSDTRQKYLTLMLHVINKLFLVNAGRIFVAFLWGVCSYIIAVVLRPIVANVFLFGKNVNNKGFNFLKPIRKLRMKQHKFGIKV